MRPRHSKSGQGKIEAIIAAALLLATVVIFCLCYQPTRGPEARPAREAAPAVEKRHAPTSRVRPEARIASPRADIE